MIETNEERERESRKSVLAAQLNDDDDDVYQVTNQFKPWKILTVFDSIMVVGVLTLCIASVLVWFMLFVVERGHKTAEVTKNICCAKGEGTVDRCFVDSEALLKKTNSRESDKIKDSSL